VHRSPPTEQASHRRHIGLRYGIDPGIVIAQADAI
jgi:hypothetical protein